MNMVGKYSIIGRISTWIKRFGSCRCTECGSKLKKGSRSGCYYCPNVDCDRWCRVVK
jgi:hypothetical protein